MISLFFLRENFYALHAVKLYMGTIVYRFRFSQSLLCARVWFSLAFYQIEMEVLHCGVKMSLSIISSENEEIDDDS